MPLNWRVWCVGVCLPTCGHGRVTGCSARLPDIVRLCFGQPCSPCESGRFRRPSPRSPSLSLRVDSCTARVTDKRRLPAYTYTPSGASPAVIVSLSKVPPGFGPKQSRAWHPRELGQCDACSSRPPGKSSTPPACCIHRPRCDTSSAGYRLLVSLASAGASREPESRRSPALAPHTRRLGPTFRCGAFFFVASALVDVPSARLTLSAAKPSRGLLHANITFTTIFGLRRFKISVFLVARQCFDCAL